MVPENTPLNRNRDRQLFERVVALIVAAWQEVRTQVNQVMVMTEPLRTEAQGKTAPLTPRDI